MGHRQPHDLLLDMLGKARVDGRLAARMGQLAPVEQAQDTSPAKAPHIALQSPIAQSRRMAVLSKGPLMPQHRPNRFIARERIPIGRGIAEEEVQLEHTGGMMGYGILLPSTLGIREDMRGGSYDV
jgi:hypothetical protein